jgi:hypothetical protein
LNNDSELTIKIKNVEYNYISDTFGKFNYKQNENNSKLDISGFWYLIIEIFKADNFYDD